jgi:hypothetical protein
MNNFEYKYIIVSDTGDWKWCNNLGHEIFFTRKILLLLLHNKLITNNSIIVTSYKDRRFMYENYFNKILIYEEYKSLNQNVDSVLNLSPYLLSLFAAKESFLDAIGAPNGKTSTQLKKLGLDKEYLLENEIFQNTNTPEFNKFICNLNYCDVYEYNKIINKQFFIIHIRPGCKFINYLLTFIDYCKSKKKLECIIFTTLKISGHKYQTNNLQMYASLMHHNNCLGLLSEWSGGGQLSQFCAKKVIYYYDHYPDDYKTELIKEYVEQNNNNFYEAWDHYNPINCIKMFINNEELTNIDKLYSHVIKTN